MRWLLPLGCTRVRYEKKRGREPFTTTSPKAPLFLYKKKPTHPRKTNKSASLIVMRPKCWDHKLMC